MKSKKRKNGIIIFLVILLIALGGFSYYMISDYSKQLDEATIELSNQIGYINQNTRYLYVALTDIAMGDVIEEGVNVEERSCLTALPSGMYIGKEQLGNVAVIDIVANTPVFSNMVTEERIADDVREVEIGVARLPLNIESNEYYDLRVRFANGLDYIVCSKLRVRDFDLENSIFYTDLEEGQLLTLSSATVESYMNTGTKVYLAKYQQPTLQADAIPTYPVNDAIYNLILADPNIVEVAEEVLNREARLSLAAYLGTLTEDELRAVSEGESLADTAHGAALSAHIEAMQNAEYNYNYYGETPVVDAGAETEVETEVVTEDTGEVTEE